jgi:hypothetical protein
VAPAELFPVAAGVAHRGTFVLRVATGPSAAALYVALAYRVAQAAAFAAQVHTHLATEDSEASEPCREAADMAGLGRARPRFRFVDRLQPVQQLVKLEGPPEVNAAAVEAGVAALLIREPPRPGCSLAVLQCWRGDDDRSKAKLAARAEFHTLPKPVARDAALRAFFSSSPDHRVNLASPEVARWPWFYGEMRTSAPWSGWHCSPATGELRQAPYIQALISRSYQCTRDTACAACRGWRCCHFRRLSAAWAESSP